MPEKVKPLTEVMVIGKTKRGGEPFPISGQRGLYFFIPVEEFDWLRKVNDAYKTLYRESCSRGTMDDTSASSLSTFTSLRISIARMRSYSRPRRWRKSGERSRKREGSRSKSRPRANMFTV